MIARTALGLLLSIFVSQMSHAQDDDPVPSGVFFGDIHNLAIGAFNRRSDTYLFAMPKDHPAADRGMLWGEMLVVQGAKKKRPFVSIFDCGPVISHFTPVLISFSEDDKYLIVESGGEGGAALDVFDVAELFVESLETEWKGTDKCVKPLATVGSHDVPVAFEGWKGHVPIVSSSIPLDRVSTSKDVPEGEDERTFLWDIGTGKFTPVKAR